MEISYSFCDICGDRYESFDGFISQLEFNIFDKDDEIVDKFEKKYGDEGTSMDICIGCFEKYILPLKHTEKNNGSTIS